MRLDRHQTAFILIDVQGNLAHAMHEKTSLFKNLGILLKSAAILEIPIIWMEQVPKALGPTLPELAAEISGQSPIAKTSFSCCDNADFRNTLETINRKTFIITGIETHICVYQTAIDLIRQGFDVQVASDAVSSRTPENKALGLERMRHAGALITGTEMLLFELIRDATDPDFKSIAKLVK